MNRASKTTDERLIFWCPGCGCYHGAKVSTGGWEWNGSLEFPTLRPSLLTTGEMRCHSFVTDGKIQFLSDCTHHLAGQIVDLGDVDLTGEDS